MTIQWLEEWYSNNCNGDWEHDYGITITTIDNPGWDITIDLADTIFDLPNEDWKLIKESESSWYGYKVTNNVFNASGDPKRLNFLIQLFKRKIEVSA